MVKVKDLPKGAGHRGRLRDRFLQSGLDGFLDYEIVELLLTLGTPRKDCKQLAKAAIKKYNGLRGVLDTSLDELQIIKGIGPSNAFGIKLFQAMAARYAKEQLSDKISLTSPQAVANYLKETLGREKKEHFVILLLDPQNKLIHLESISVGTVNEALVHPREVFEPAIRRLATKVIIAHNHPSGELEPSDEDLRLTQRLVSVGAIIDIPVVDHVIISSRGYFSLKQKRLLQ
jgi:DNA repair protein RadC